MYGPLTFCASHKRLNVQLWVMSISASALLDVELVEMLARKFQTGFLCRTWFS